MNEVAAATTSPKLCKKSTLASLIGDQGQMVFEDKEPINVELVDKHNDGETV